MDLYLAGRERQRLARPGARVGWPPADLYGRVVGRCLPDDAAKCIQRRLRIHAVRRRRDARDFSLAIIGVRFRTEGNQRHVDLRRGVQSLGELRALADEDGQEPGRRRIERSAVADAAHAQRLPRDGDDIEGGPALGFVDREHARRGCAYL